MPRKKTIAGKRPRRAKRMARSRSRAPQAPRARAIEAALADIAHEIRTPLTGILALGELLATSELGERERGWATAIKSTAEHVAAFTSLIVDAARADAKGLAAETEISSELPEAVIGDPLRLRAALENLIDNAVKFTERGRVHLDVSRAKAARGKAQLVFTLSDTGIGLTAAEI